MHGKTIIFFAGIALGIVVGLNSPLATEVALFALVLGLVQLALYGLSRRISKEGNVSLLTSIFLCALFIGVLRVQFIVDHTPYVCEKACTFDAVIIHSPEQKETYQSIVARPLNANVSSLAIQVRAPLYPAFHIGETVELSGKVAVPETIYPHGDVKSFDYLSYLHIHDIGSEIIFPKITLIDSEPHTLTSLLGRVKENMVSMISRYVAPPASSLSNGMLFGDNSLSKELTQTFRIAGLSHIIVLSGFNIAIVISCVLFVFTFLPLSIRIVFASLFVLAFVVMVGGEASVVRATIMAFIGLLATLVGRQYVAKQALLLSLLAIILYEPQALMADVSLHLSFLATAGIVYASQGIKNYLKRTPLPNFVVELASTTLAAYAATLPYIMYVFGTVSIYGLVANLLVLPLVPLAMLMSFLVVVFSYISPTLALVCGYLETHIGQFIIYIAQTVEGLPFSQVHGSLSFVSMCAMYAAIVLAVYYFLRKKNETFETTEDGYVTGIISY